MPTPVNSREYAPPPPMMSNCCEAPLETSYGEEGTNCYVCTKCKNPSDPIPPSAKATEDTSGSGGEYTVKHEQFFHEDADGKVIPCNHDPHCVIEMKAVNPTASGVEKIENAYGIKGLTIKSDPTMKECEIRIEPPSSGGEKCAHDKDREYLFCANCPCTAAYCFVCNKQCPTCGKGHGRPAPSSADLSAGASAKEEGVGEMVDEISVIAHEGLPEPEADRVDELVREVVTASERRGRHSALRPAEKDIQDIAETIVYRIWNLYAYQVGPLITPKDEHYAYMKVRGKMLGEIMYELQRALAAERRRVGGGEQAKDRGCYRTTYPLETSPCCGFRGRGLSEGNNVRG